MGELVADSLSEWRTQFGTDWRFQGRSQSDEYVVCSNPSVVRKSDSWGE